MSTNQSSQTNAATKKKVSRSETGHLKNVTNFEDMISFCTSFGSVYNPSNLVLTLPKLNLKYEEGKNVLAELASLRTKFDAAIDMRRIEFENVKSLGMRAVNSFAVSGVDKLIVETAKTHLRKLQGSSKRKKIEATTEEKNGEMSETKEVKQISTSQLSYDRQIDHLTYIVEVFTQSGVYNPNETELTIAALNDKINKLKEVNTMVINQYTAYYNAMTKRNEVLYTPLTGLVDVAKMVKLYVKSVFGVNSPQYKQINSIEFRNR